MQLSYLQSILCKLIAGEYEVGLNFMQAYFRNTVEIDCIPPKKWAMCLPHMYMWFDYWSVPRTSIHEDGSDIDKAIESIPYYIEQATLFLILAPPCARENSIRSYATWRRQGWCRMEMICAFLAARDVTILICDGGKPLLARPWDALHLAPGRGEFSCCDNNHLINGQTIVCDRIRVRQILEAMIKSQDMRDLEDEHEGALARFFMANSTTILHGLDGSMELPEVSETSDLKTFEEILALHGQKKHIKLLYACVAGNHEIVKQLVNAGNVNYKMPQGAAGLGNIKLPLHAAMMNACTFETVKVLLDAKADPLAKNDFGNTAIMGVAVSGSAKQVQAWLCRFPRWNLQERNGYVFFRWTALQLAARYSNDPMMVPTLLKARADVHAVNDMGLGALACAVMNPDSRAETIQSLIDAGADVNRKQESSSCSWLVWSLYWSASVSVAFGSRDSRLEYLTNLQGATPFQLARQTFNEEVLRALVEAGADTRSRPRGDLLVSIPQGSAFANRQSSSSASRTFST
jgi:ankyrin repeat protein